MFFNIYNFLRKLAETIVKTTKTVHKVAAICHRKLMTKMWKLISLKMIDLNELLV